MTAPLRIACIQENPVVGDLDANLAMVREARRRYRGRVDLLVFSECFATGYPLQDLAGRRGFLRDTRKAMTALVSEIEGDEGPAVLVGAIVEGVEKPFNGAWLLDTDGSVRVSLKHRLPNEQVYDERRIFAEGPMPVPMAFRGWNLGVAVCEDFWHGDVTRSLADAGADVFVVLNGSHFRVGKQARRRGLCETAARRHGIPVVYVNQVGGQDGLVFDGASLALDRHGGLIAQAISFRPASFELTLEHGEHGVEMSLGEDDKIVSRPDLSEPYPDALRALYEVRVLGVRDFFRKTGAFQGIGVAMSGGLDSAVVAAIAGDAVGPDKVWLLAMPSAISAGDSVTHARQAADLLGMRLAVLPIAGAVAASREMLSAVGRDFEAPFDRLPPELDASEENDQARVRGTAMMNLSNRYGLLVLTTGNKSEVSTGFMTLGGDMMGGLAPIADLYKVGVPDQDGLRLGVRSLAEWRNKEMPHGGLGRRGPVIPQAIIDKPPSADLKEGQIDEQVLGAFEDLDPFLDRLVEHQEEAVLAARRASEATGRDVSAEYGLRIARMVRANQHKRNLAAPGVVTSSRDFGMDHRYPVAGRYSL